MLQEMMKACCGEGGQPELGKMKEFMEDHDRGARLDTIGWSFFFIWVGIAWLTDVGISIGLLGVAVITLVMQLVRKLQGLRVEVFWVVVGAAFGVGGLWELFDIQAPLAPLVLIIVGIVLLGWRFSPRRKDARPHG